MLPVKNYLYYTLNPMALKEILIIEDDEFNCFIYKEILSNAFTSISFAHDGQEGIDRFKEKSYDLVLLDLGLPKINGLEVLRLIKEFETAPLRSATTPIIIITANSFPGTKEIALAAGAHQYLTKPFNIEELKNLAGLYLYDKV